jgi:hypothetical protein
LLIDRKPGYAALYSFLCGLLTLFGAIHSIRPSEEVYLPWQAASLLTYRIAVAYFLMAGILLLFRKSLNAYQFHEAQNSMDMTSPLPNQVKSLTA